MSASSYILRIYQSSIPPRSRRWYPRCSVSFSFARPRNTYTFCVPFLAVFLLICLMMIYPYKPRDHDSNSRSCKRLHAIFTKAGLEPPLPPSPPKEWNPVFRVHITPAPPGLSRSKTGPCSDATIVIVRTGIGSLGRIWRELWRTYGRVQRRNSGWSGAVDYYY